MILFGCRTTKVYITVFVFGAIMLKNKVKTGGSILLIPAEDILPTEYSSRKIVSLEELYRLSDSIKASGILCPLIVSPGIKGSYRLISGERRRRAAIIAGCDMLPCVVMEADEYDTILYNVCENLHRKELHFLEIAATIDELHNIMSVSEIAERLSVSEGVILSRIKLLNLPENVRWKIISGNLSESQANALVRVEDSVRQNDIADLMVSSGCSFREAYELTEKLPKKSVFKAHFRDFKIFENTIQHAIDTMIASGIEADSEKITDDGKITYTVTINKLIKR